MKRLRCHNRDTGYGKTFVAFLSQIVRSYMLKQLRPMMQEKTDKTPLLILRNRNIVRVTRRIIEMAKTIKFNLICDEKPVRTISISITHKEE